MGKAKRSYSVKSGRTTVAALGDRAHAVKAAATAAGGLACYVLAVAAALDVKLDAEQEAPSFHGPEGELSDLLIPPSRAELVAELDVAAERAAEAEARAYPVEELAAQARDEHDTEHGETKVSTCDYCRAEHAAAHGPDCRECFEAVSA